MKYIREVNIDKIAIFKDIKNFNVSIDKLTLKLSSNSDFSLLLENDSELKKITNLLDEIKSIKNIESVKKDFYKNISFLCVEDAIKNNVIDSFRESLILRDLEQALRYSEHLKKPMSNSEEVFFDPKKLDTLYSENVDPLYYQNIEHMCNFIINVLVPYYKEKESNNYKKIIMNKINDFIEIIVANVTWNTLDEFLKIFYPGSVIKNKKIVANILTNSYNSDKFLEKILFHQIKKEYKNIDKIYDLFINPEGMYYYIYKFFIKNIHQNSPHLLYLLSKHLKKRLPKEAELVIMSSEGIAKDYIQLNKTFNKDVIIKTPGEIVKELVKSKSGRPDPETEDLILNGDTHFLVLYFKTILKSTWEGNEDIRKKFEESLSRNVSDSATYFFKLIEALPKDKQNPEYINYYIDNYISPKIIQSILKSNFRNNLIDFVELTRRRLPPDQEDLIRGYQPFWIRYQQLVN